MASGKPATRGARGEQHIGALLAREIEQMKQRALVETVRLQVLDHQRAGRKAAGRSTCVEQFAASTRAPAVSAQIAARWLLPEPSGPISATMRSGQSGQRSISASAAAFEGPRRKSSRAKLSA